MLGSGRGERRGALCAAESRLALCPIVAFPYPVLVLVLLSWLWEGTWVCPVSFQMPFPPPSPGLSTRLGWGHSSVSTPTPQLSLPPGPHRDLPLGKEMQGLGRNQFPALSCSGPGQAELQVPLLPCFSQLSSLDTKPLLAPEWGNLTKGPVNISGQGSRPAVTQDQVTEP